MNARKATFFFNILTKNLVFSTICVNTHNLTPHPPSFRKIAKVHNSFRDSRFKIQDSRLPLNLASPPALSKREGAGSVVIDRIYLLVLSLSRKTLYLFFLLWRKSRRGRRLVWGRFRSFVMLNEALAGLRHPQPTKIQDSKIFFTAEAKNVERVHLIRKIRVVIAVGTMILCLFTIINH